jgi:hypothetical protein
MKPIEPGQLRKWIPECDVGFGPFVIIDIIQKTDGMKEFLYVDDMIVRVMYGDGRVIKHGFLGMDEDSFLLDDENIHSYS